VKVIVSLEQRFDRAPDGTVWVPGTFGYAYWKRYLGVFDQVEVLARVRDVNQLSSGWIRSDGDGVVFLPVPYYIGPWQYLLCRGEVNRVCRKGIDNCAVIMRVPSAIASSVHMVLRSKGQPYGVEVVGDPYDVFGSGGVRHPLRPVFRRIFHRDLQAQCRSASAAAYVTRECLQARYPCGSLSLGVSDVDLPQQAFVTSYSSVELGRGAFAGRPRSASKRGSATLISVGTLEQLYKGGDVLIRALSRCRQEGLDLRLVWVGDGRYRKYLESLSARYGVAGGVEFRGQLSAGDAVRAELDRADLFVLASRTEGLPRAMVEAMARALPCIGSNVGGIPELLPPEDLAPPGGAKALARKIREVVTNPARMAQMSARNLEKAQEYREEVLRGRRLAFYRFVRQQTEAWVQAMGGG